jgi:hypothetical protein
MPAVPLDAGSEIPQQAVEPWRTRALCANCPFSETDPDDHKLYCKESSPGTQAIIGPSRPLLAVPATDKRVALGVVGIVTFWPEVNANWSCWKHPARQQERRKYESGL